MQFIAECGIEYGLQFVTQFFLNPLNFLYTKKSWEFLQSYEKSLKVVPMWADIFYFIGKISQNKHKRAGSFQSFCWSKLVQTANLTLYTLVFSSVAEIFEIVEMIEVDLIGDTLPDGLGGVGKLFRHSIDSSEDITSIYKYDNLADSWCKCI